MGRPLFTFSLPSDTLNSLLKAGFKTYEDLFSSSSKTEPTSEVIQILEYTGFPWEEFKKLVSPSFKMSGANILALERQRSTLPTFSEALDNILGGGVPLGSVIHVCGPPGSGKTQLLMQLCVDVQIPVSMGGLNSQAVFIDSERGFTKHRLHEIAEATVKHCKRIGKMYNLIHEIENFSADTLLQGVRYIEVNSYVELLASIHLLSEYISKNNVKLIVIDSIVMCLLNISNTLDRTRYLSRIVKLLHHLASQNSVAVVVTNDLTTWISPRGDKMLLPSLGESASHLFPTILLLANHSNYFSALIHKSSSQIPQVANFQVLKDGIRDVNMGT